MLFVLLWLLLLLSMLLMFVFVLCDHFSSPSFLSPLMPSSSLLSLSPWLSLLELSLSLLLFLLLL